MANNIPRTQIIKMLSIYRLTVDEYGTVWYGEPGEGIDVGDLVDRDEETLQILWRKDDYKSLEDDS